jgi:hypothetical protein
MSHGVSGSFFSGNAFGGAEPRPDTRSHVVVQEFLILHRALPQDVHCLALGLNVSPQSRQYGEAGLGDRRERDT